MVEAFGDWDSKRSFMRYEFAGMILRWLFFSQAGSSNEIKTDLVLVYCIASIVLLGLTVYS